LTGDNGYIWRTGVIMLGSFVQIVRDRRRPMAPGLMVGRGRAATLPSGDRLRPARSASRHRADHPITNDVQQIQILIACSRR
jgi:hypothetical protein